MLDRKNGNRRVGAVSTRRVLSSAGSGDIFGAVSVDVGEVIGSACRDFARAADWQPVPQVVPPGEDCGAEGPEMVYRLREDHEGLHSGRYINVSVLRAANEVAIRGGYYDGYWQPRTLYSESVPLKELTAQTLGCLLMEIHDRLCSGDRAKTG
jgi:hypothetical protein